MTSGAARLGLRLAATAVIVVGLSSLGEYPANSLSGLAPAGEPGRTDMTGEPLPRLKLAGAGQDGIRSVLNLGEAMDHGEFVWDEEGVPPGDVWVRVDLDNQLISVFRGGHEIGTAVVLYGADEKPTPPGTFTVLAKRKDHHSSLYDAPMPYTLRLTDDGISIHGSDVRARTATHGCVGLPLEFAALLFGQVEVGDEVVILSGTHSSAA